ncbi:MAG: hypothetical protein WCE80_03355 [Acidimicrobiia bacterium]
MTRNVDSAPETMKLGPEDSVRGRPFTAIDKTAEDLRVLHMILADVRSVVVDVEEGAREVLPFQRLAWRVGGLTHRLLICDVGRLRSHTGLCVVGFFAERRTEVDVRPLEKANSEIVTEFANYPGILTYASVELPDGHWGNLVLHDDPVDTEYWRTSRMHAKAVETLSPQHYHNVRIHNGRLTAGIFDRPTIRIEKTKYFDYSGASEWRAERAMGPA